MRKLLMLLCVMFVCVTVVSAADTWHFSDCAEGGAGTASNPYCLDPVPNFPDDECSFGWMFLTFLNGLSNGDTILLCAGACNGSGSATWLLEPCLSQTSLIESAAWVDDITIKPYPGESVTIDGDYNEDGDYDSGVDLDWLVTDNDIEGMTLEGFGITQFQGGLFRSEEDCEDITIDNMTVDRIHEGFWDGSLFGAPNFGEGVFIEDPSDVAGNNLIIRGSTFTKVAHHGIEIDQNEAANVTITIENNSFTNMTKAVVLIAADGATVVNNTFNDNRMSIIIGQDSKDVDITDNIIESKDAWKNDGSGDDSWLGIGVSDMFPIFASTDNLHDIRILRNQIFYDDAGDANKNWGIFWEGGCLVGNGCDESPNYIRNNMIWGPIGCDAPGGELGPGGIYIETDQPNESAINFFIESNTIRKTHYGIFLDDSNASGKGFGVYSNIVNLTDVQELNIDDGVADIEYNNLRDTSGVVYDPTPSTAKECSDFPIGTNICKAIVFRSVSGASGTWDLRLHDDDTNNRDIIPTGAFCPSVDEQNISRPIGSKCEIGADEDLFICQQPCGPE